MPSAATIAMMLAAMYAGFLPTARTIRGMKPATTNITPVLTTVRMMK